ncbi:unnamed protein product [Tenebrio molitor]|nr:unnamed protein product [Tenebrio molitor]
MSLQLLKVTFVVLLFILINVKRNHLSRQVLVQMSRLKLEQ